MDPIFITADRLFDGTGSATTVRPIVKVQGERIEEIQGSLLPPSGCSGDRYDFPGCTILPGLIDTHVHLIFSAAKTHAEVVDQVTRETEEQLLQRAADNAKAALKAGITTLRDCGAKGTISQQLRDRIRTGDNKGPDIISCGVPITTTTGHCHWLGLIADSSDEVRRVAEKMIAEDADWLKVMATGGNMTPSSDPMSAQFDDAALALITEIGRQGNKHSAAHVLSLSAMPGVIGAGYRTIEHCNWRIGPEKYEFDPALGQKIKDQPQYIGLTMSGITRRSLVPETDFPSTYQPLMEALDARFACEREMIEFGIPYTIHSDAGVGMTPIHKYAEGLRAAKVELQLTPAEVIRAATATAAVALDLHDRGRIAPGKRSDLLVVEGNPLQDISCLEKVRAVMKAGSWVSGEIPAPIPKVD